METPHVPIDLLSPVPDGERPFYDLAFRVIDRASALRAREEGAWRIPIHFAEKRSDSLPPFRAAIPASYPIPENLRYARGESVEEALDRLFDLLADSEPEVERRFREAAPHLVRYDRVVDVLKADPVTGPGLPEDLFASVRRRIAHGGTTLANLSHSFTREVGFGRWVFVFGTDPGGAPGFARLIPSVPALFSPSEAKQFAYEGVELARLAERIDEAWYGSDEG